MPHNPPKATGARARAYVFGTPNGEYQESIRTAWESLLLVANIHATKRESRGQRVDRQTLGSIDLHWHDLRHEGACRPLADGVDIRAIQPILGHSDVKQTQRYLNVTDEELWKTLSELWQRRRNAQRGRRTMSRKQSGRPERSRIRSARKCYLCPRNELSPMCPERTRY